MGLRRFGGRFVPRSVIEQLPGAARWLDRHPPAEPWVVDALHALIRPGDTVVDVGAHMGTLTTHMARAVGPWGRVIAVEANPRTASALSERFRGAVNVRVHNLAASDRSGDLEFFVDPVRSARSTLVAEHAGPGFRSVIVPSLPLDELLEGESPSLVKVDVEGAEDRVIRGMTKLIAKSPPALIVEFHRGSEAARASLMALREADYEVKDLTTGQAVEGHVPPYLGVALAKERSQGRQ